MGKRFVFDDGPWTFDKKGDDYVVKSSENKTIAIVKENEDGTALANARVISATPDIFQALLCFLTLYEESDVLENEDEEKISLAITAAKLALLKTARAKPESEE